MSSFQLTGGSLNFEKSEFRRKFDKEWFSFSHAFAENELFSMPRLAQLAMDIQSHRPNDMYCDSEVASIGQRWNESNRPANSIDQVIRTIEQGQAWVVLKRCERDPDYMQILNAAMGQILELTGPQIEKVVDFKEVIIFITSPGRLTTYHIDRECNFIAQIAGKKNIYLFDKDDREILPEEEIERFWTIDNNSAIYKPEYQDRAFTFELKPGNGIHVPIGAPHWLQNGDNVSVTMSMNFHFVDSERRDVYRANHYLRKLGIHPSPPFAYPMRDSAKKMAWVMASRTAKLPRAIGRALTDSRQALRSQFSEGARATRPPRVARED